MAAPKGHEKIGGRQPGGKNKNTLILETFAQTIVEGGMERFQQELNKLSGKDYINAYMTLFEFVKPKLARTEIKGEMKNTTLPDLSHLTTEEITKLLNDERNAASPSV
jgi:hypothetical protein